MTLPRRLLAILFLFAAALVCTPGQTAALSTEDSAKQIWQLLDYLAVDYGGAVADGKVKDQSEFSEMQEFAQTAEHQLAELPDRAEKAGLLQQAATLKTAIAARASAADVGERARGLAAGLLAAYPVPVAPSKAPSLQQGQALYAAQCASCHGAQGRGDGPLAAQLNPPPVAFSDRDRARARSLFSLHQTISNGVPGTSMPSFASLSDDDRWALSFFSVLVAGALAWWALKAERRTLAAAIGLVIGGAVGNAIDRIQYGYVVDFIDFSGTGVFPWVFNVADSAITVGVLLLILDSVMSERKQAVGAAPEKA